jgi:hypothetical protein
MCDFAWDGGGALRQSVGSAAECASSRSSIYYVGYMGGVGWGCMIGGSVADSTFVCVGGGYVAVHQYSRVRV